METIVNDFKSRVITEWELWSILSDGKEYKGVFLWADEAAAAYRACGYVPFEGYPLIKLTINN